MIYFILAFILLIYFELLGQAILNYLKKDLYIFSFGIGIIAWLAIAYISTSILTALDCSFYLILFIYSIIFIISLYLIIKKIKYLKIGIINWLILIIVSTIILYYSFNTSLGDLNGFDSTHYINMVTSNIGLDKLNSKSVVDGTFTKNISYQYTFQSYYYLASCILFIFDKACSLMNITFEAGIAFIWIFQYLYNYLFISIILIALNKFFNRKYLLHIIVVLFFILCYFRIYYNSAFGFYGNTYRTIILAYTSLFLIELFNRDDISTKFLFGMSLLAACAVSSSTVFMVFLSLFATFFIFIDRNDKLFKEYAIILFVPSINLFTILKSSILSAIGVSLVLCLLLYFCNDILTEIIRKYHLKKYLLIASFLLMFMLSYRFTHDIFNFDAFFNSSNEQYDMTLNYFNKYVGYRAIEWYKFIAVLSMMMTLIFKRKEDMSKMIWILIIVFFNPFCCSFLNEINVVYYRAYDLIINPFILVWLFKKLEEMLEFKYAYSIIATVLVCAMVTSESPKSLLYWHGSFKPQDNYDYLYKMDKNELDVLNRLKDEIEYNKIGRPFIITPNLRTLSFIPDGEYLYGREYRINDNWDEAKNELYAIFYPVLYYGDEAQPDNPDYEHMCEYINDAEVDFIVQDKSVDYYDEKDEVYYSLTYKIDECGTYPIYESDDYALYMFER